MRANLLLTVLLLSLATLAAQQHSLSGCLRDASSGETLIGATLYLESAHTGTTTNVQLILFRNQQPIDTPTGANE